MPAAASAAAARNINCFTTLDGTSDSGATTPDSAAIDITGDIDIRAMINYTGDNTQQAIISHWPAAGDKKWLFEIDSGGALSLWNADGGGSAFSDSTVDVNSVAGISPGATIGLRVTYDVSASQLQFFTSIDVQMDGTATWVQLGANVSTGKTSLQSTAETVQVGNAADTTTSEIYWCEVYDGIDGTLVIRFDAGDHTTTSGAFTSRRTGEVWTPNGSPVWTSTTPYWRDRGSVFQLMDESTVGILAQDQTGQTDPVHRTGSGSFLGSIAATSDSNDPTFMSHDGDNYFYMPGDAGNYVSTPDAAAQDITGDIDFTFDIALDDWTATNQTVLAKWLTTGNQGSYQVFFTASTIRLQLSSTGSDFPVTNVALSFLDGGLPADGARMQFRIKYTASTSNVKYYEWLADDWSEFGDKTTSITSIYASTAIVTIGAREGSSELNMSGKVYDAKVYDGFLDGGGTLISHFDANDAVDGVAWTGTADGLDWTPTYSTTANTSKLMLVDRPMWWHEESDEIRLPSSYFSLDNSTDDGTFFAVQRWVWDGADFRRFLAIGDASGPYLGLDTDAGDQVTTRAYDGVTAAAGGNRSGGLISGEMVSVAMVVDGSAQTVDLFTSKSGVEATSTDVSALGDYSPDADASAGKQVSAGYGPHLGLVAVLWWDRVLTLTELEKLSRFYGIDSAVHA